MNRQEARQLLTEQLAAYRRRSYSELVQMIKDIDVIEVQGPSGAEYQIEIEASWDSPREKVNVRVIAAIDDGHFFSALAPVCNSFIMAPDGTFVGEQAGSR
jgi:hypothetical protein